MYICNCILVTRRLLGDNASDFEDPDFDDVVDDAVEITDEALADSPPSADISGEE